MIEIFKSGLIDTRWVPRLTTTWAVIHHAKAINCTVYDIDKWHIEQGFYRNGYNFFIDKKGGKWECRPIEIEGAHTLGYNDVSIGICLEGNFEIERLGIVQKLALIDLLNYIVEKYPKIKIVPHNYLNDTECPVSVANELPDILSKIKVKVPRKSNDEAIQILENRVTELEFIIKRITDKLNRIEKL